MCMPHFFQTQCRKDGTSNALLPMAMELPNKVSVLWGTEDTLNTAAMAVGTNCYIFIPQKVWHRKWPMKTANFFHLIVRVEWTKIGKDRHRATIDASEGCFLLQFDTKVKWRWRVKNPVTIVNTQWDSFFRGGGCCSARSDIKYGEVKNDMTEAKCKVLSTTCLATLNRERCIFHAWLWLTIPLNPDIPMLCSHNPVNHIHAYIKFVIWLIKAGEFMYHRGYIQTVSFRRISRHWSYCETLCGRFTGWTHSNSYLDSSAVLPQTATAKFRRMLWEMHSVYYANVSIKICLSY